MAANVTPATNPRVPVVIVVSSWMVSTARQTAKRER
jgi:hypothetical protein